MNAKHRDLKHAAGALFLLIAFFSEAAWSADYFSTVDGSWNSVNRWRYGAGASCAGGGTLSDTTTYPGSAASDTVTICTGDDITLPISPANAIVSLTTIGTGTLASSTTDVTLTVNGDVTNAGTITFNGAAGVFTLDVNGDVANAGNILVSANNRVHAFSVSGDISGNGAIDLRNGSNARIANLTLDGANTQTLSGTGNIEFYTVTAASATHEFDINKTGGTVSIGSTLDLAGDLTMTDGTLSISGASGVAQSILVDGDIDVDAGAVVSIANVTLTHVLDLGGNLTNDGTFDMVLDNNSRCRVNFLGAGPVAVSGGGTTEFNIIGVDLAGGTIADVVDVTAVITMAGTGSGFVFTDGTFRLSSASSIAPASAITIPANARLELNDAGAVLTTGTTLVVNGGVLSITNNGGDVNVGNGNNENVQLDDIATSELRIAGGTLDVAGRVASAVATGGAGVFNMSGGQITVGINGNTLNAQNGAPFALGSDTTFTQSGGTIIIDESNTQANAREYDVQSTTHSVTGGTLQIGGSGTTAGEVFQIDSAAPVYNLTLDPTVATTTTLFAVLNVNHDLTIGAGTTLNLSANQAINMGNGTAGGDWINNGGTFTPGTGTVTFNGTGAQAIGGSGTTDFANLTDSNTGDILSVNVDTNVSTALTVNAAAVLVPAAAVVINNAAAAGTITGSGTIHVTRVAATADYVNQYKFTTNTLSALTVNYSGAGAQSVNAFTYGNLIASNSGTKTLAGNAPVNGDLSVSDSGVTLDLSTFTANRASSGGTLTVVNGATLRIGGTNGFPSNYATVSLGATSTVEYSGAAQAVSGEDYGHLTLSGSATKTLAATGTVAGDLTVNTSGVTFDMGAFTADRTAAGGTLTVVNGATLKIGGTNGFPANYSTVSLGGTSTVEYAGTTQNVRGLGYGNLTISGSGTKTITSADATVSGTLALSAGILDTAANQLTLGTAGTVTRCASGTSCFVAGNLVKNVPAGAPTVDWEVGTAAPSPAYAPVSITFTGAVAGNFRVTTPATAADHADVVANLVGIDPALSVNRYWTFTRMTGSATSYEPTFGYGNVAGDVDPGTTPANFIVAQKSAGFWEYPAISGTPTGSSATATGVVDANGDDFAIGEAVLAAVPLSRWLMNQSSWNGTASEVLDTAGGYHGTAAGITTVPNTDASTPPIAGSPGTCQYGVFDRTNKDYIALPGSFPNLNTAAGGFTITAWIRSTAVGNSGQRIMIDDEGNANGNWGFSLGDGGAGRLRFFYRQAATFVLDTPGGSPLASDTWYFVAVAVRLKASGNGSKAEIFVFDTAGALYTSSKGNFSVTSFGTDTTPASIGGETNAAGEGTNAFGFAGNIDMVSVFNTDLSRQHVNLVRQATTSCIQLDHIRLTHDGLGLTCAPETVTITACSDPACSLQYTGNVDTTLSPAGWVGGDAISFTGGSTTRDLQITTPGTVALGASSTTPTPAGSARCFIGLVENCNLEFKDSGFIFDVPNQTACKTSAAVTISAVRTDLTSQTCAPAFSGARTVNFWSSYINPASGSSAVSVSGTPVAGASPGTGVGLTFDVNAQATITVQYPDAGQMQLDARYDGAGAETGLVMTGNDQFVSAPAGLAVSASTSCPAGNATCPVFGKAGVDFDLDVKAACWEMDGDPDLSDNPATTPNFALAGIPVTHALVSPVGGATGGIGVTSFDFTTADAGVHTLNQSVTEVGVFTFTVTPPNYFGVPLAVATSENIGRFTPARLDIIANTPDFAHSCDGAGDDFTYMDQTFHYDTPPALTVKGVNADGNPTLNYGGEGTGANDFWRMTSTLMARSHADPDHPGFFPTPPNGDAVLSDADNYDGEGTLTLPAGSGGDALSYTRGASPVAPFNAAVDLTFANATSVDGLMDGDDICYDPDNDGCEASDTFSINDITGSGSGTAQQRFGRLVIGTAAGSELLPLAVRMEAEYFNGTAFVLNTDDSGGSCTAIDSADVDTSGAGCAAGATAPTVAHSPLLGGQAGLTLSAPGATCTGDVGITVDLSTATGVDHEWLRYDWDGDGGHDNDPTGRASFGVFGGDEHLIYIREPWN